MSRELFRHVKRGTIYEVIGVGHAQGTIDDEDPVVLYRGEDGGLWVRHQAEFCDGRFERLPDSQPLPATTGEGEVVNADQLAKEFMRQNDIPSHWDTAEIYTTFARWLVGRISTPNEAGEQTPVDDDVCPKCNDSGFVETTSGGIWTGENVLSARSYCDCPCGIDARDQDNGTGLHASQTPVADGGVVRAAIPVEKGEACRFAECPPGLFLYADRLHFKSEYSSKVGLQDAYCLDSGEYFWGGAGNADARRELLVLPLVGTAADTSYCIATPDAVRERDAARLDALRDGSWDLRCFDIPTGGDDAEIGWRVVGHWMAKPHERTIAEVYTDDPRAAIDAALRTNPVTEGE